MATGDSFYEDLYLLSLLRQGSQDAFTQIVAEPQGNALAGAYAQVGLPLEGNQTLLAPTNTLLIRGSGTLVATVAENGQVSLRPIVVGRNFGADF